MESIRPDQGPVLKTGSSAEFVGENTVSLAVVQEWIFEGWQDK